MPLADQDKTAILSKNLFPVVGIGASAGGLEAFKRLVKAIPEKSGMAYILVQHLHPDHSSSLPEILQRETTIPVHEISDNVEVKPDQVYIIPANKMLVATDGILQLSPRPSKDQKNMPIDIFFSSLAEVHQSHAIGIVLSGTGADGTLGLKDIKGQGGITFAQDPPSAAFDAMPQSAINAEVVDFVLAPERMPQQLLELNKTFNILPSNDNISQGSVSEDDNFKQILSLIRSRKGVDFTYYKQTTIRRRILRRIAILKLSKVADYLDVLRQNKAEQDILFQDLLIPVTAFFRDPKTFEYLCKSVFPIITKDKSPTKPLRIWIAGCSTGEEVYSIAMCLHEYLSDKISALKIQIFATDISEKAILKARTGVYHKREIEGVSDLRLQLFFTKADGSYQIKKVIRDMCVFACHNFLKDPPFARLDLISCRNVLIYLEPFLQRKAFTTFHYALNEKGYLLLGKSETTGSSSELFLSFEKKEKLFIKSPLPGRFMTVTSESREETLKDRDYGIRSNERKKDDFQKNADEILLAKYTPVGVIVNEQFDIVQFRGSTGDFLEPSPGKASLNVLKMAREGLSFELRNALHKSKATNDVFRKDGISINNGKRLVMIEVIPLTYAIDPHYLILFKNSGAENYTDANDEANSVGSVESEKITRVQQLEKNLLQAREDMRSISEEQEAANEELQSANEELLSGSEELQSLNEELETSKEELQSTNEELVTVNQELVDRNEQFNLARIYAETIVTTIHEPILIIGHDLRIVSANKAFYKHFSISEDEVIGKVLFELQDNQWNIPEMQSQFLRIQKGKEKFLEWEITFAFPTIGSRTICFNAQPILREDGENWIMLAFNDITIWKNKEATERENAEELKRILETLPLITITASPEGTSTYFNQFFLNYVGVSMEEALDQGWEQAVKPEMRPGFESLWTRSIATGKDFTMEVELKRKSDNKYRWHIWRASAIRNSEGVITSWVSAVTDIQEQKTKEEGKDEFISIASHELKTPLTTAKAYVQLLASNIEADKGKDLLYVRKANIAIDRLESLIGELLDVSKIQNGQLPLIFSSFNFCEMVTAAIEQIQNASAGCNIVEIGGTTLMMKGDKQRLEQVVINLLSNAVKYSPRSDKIVVEVTQDGNNAMFSVKDNGIGIRKENLERIFERYYREDGKAFYFQGLGIGLSISYNIIQRHNGKIWAESVQDKGSTFYFTVPIS